MNTAWAEIDLKALRHNAKVVRRLAPKSKIMAMLKADAYGHGLERCAVALHDFVDGFAVARLEEAESLRQVYPDFPILILASSLDRAAIEWCVAQQVKIAVHDAEILRKILALPKPPGVWLKLNTGMNRLGFSPQEYQEAMQALLARGADIVAMTHFASADEPERTETHAQIERFDRVLRQLPPVEQSLCNSAGLVAYPQVQRDWVRPGIMLYGANPMLDQQPLDLRPVMRLKARVLAVHDLNTGDAVGYGGAWKASSQTRIATVGLGYGDGFPRVVNGAQLELAGQIHPIVGRVSMDLLSVEIGARTDIKVGDIASLWGEAIRVEQTAAAAGTISYELLCRIQSRVSRVVTVD